MSSDEVLKVGPRVICNKTHPSMASADAFSIHNVQRNNIRLTALILYFLIMVTNYDIAGNVNGMRN